MSCKSCSTGGCGSVKIKDKDGKVEKTAGCNSNGGCSTGGCNKMNVFDWLSNMEMPQAMRFNIVEIKFKGGRKEYFRNTNNLDLYTGDFVVVDMPTGYHIGSVSLQGELVRLQMVKKGIKENEEIKNIQRKATEKDLEKHEQAIARDISTMYRSREIIKDLKLQMKLSDVEYQSDNSKATFYYSAEDRVDFRELIKLLAGEFKIRVEMKQISLRQEAARVGGIGSCGRELCCSTWLTDFRNIPTSAARYQSLSLNPTKLSGQCGRLKCCLNYELETYLDALSDVPVVEKSLKTQKGDAVLQKTDIFRKIMWFSYNNDSNWISISMKQVVEIQKMNENSQMPIALEDLQVFDSQAVIEKPSSINQDLDRLDKKYTKQGGFKNKGRDRQEFKAKNESRIANSPSTENKRSAQNPQENKPNSENKTANNPNRNDNRPQQKNKQNPENRQANNANWNENRPPQPQNPNQNRQNPVNKQPNNGNKPPQNPNQNRPNPENKQVTNPIETPQIKTEDGTNTEGATTGNANQNRPQGKNNHFRRNKNRPK